MRWGELSHHHLSSSGVFDLPYYRWTFSSSMLLFIVFCVFAVAWCWSSLSGVWIFYPGWRVETSIRICIPWSLHHYLSYIIKTAIRYNLYANKVFNCSSENQIAICIILTRHQQKRVCACNALLSSNASFPWPCCMSHVAGAWLVIWIFHAWRDDERLRSSRME